MSRVGSHYNTALADLRIKHNFTIVDIGEKTGIKPNTIHGWESGKCENIRNSNIPLFKVLNYCKLLNISYAQLCKYVEEAYWHRKRGRPEIFVTQNVSPLREARLKSRVNIKNIIELLGITKSTLLNWENGRQKSTSAENLKKLGLAYNLTSDEVQDLFTKTYNMFPNNHQKYVKKTKAPKIDHVLVMVDNKNEIPKIVDTAKPTTFKAETPKTDNITKKAVASVDYDALLDRLYGKISLADFRIIETLINNK